MNMPAAASSQLTISPRPTLHASVALLDLVALPAGAMYLLTTTAERFFAQRGYVRIARGSVVPAIQATREFTRLCPDSSTLMVSALSDSQGDFS